MGSNNDVAFNLKIKQDQLKATLHNVVSKFVESRSLCVLLIEQCLDYIEISKQALAQNVNQKELYDKGVEKFKSFSLETEKFHKEYHDYDSKFKNEYDNCVDNKLYNFPQDDFNKFNGLPNADSLKKSLINQRILESQISCRQHFVDLFKNLSEDIESLLERILEAAVF